MRSCLPLLVTGLLCAQEPTPSLIDARWTVEEGSSGMEVRGYKPSYFLLGRISDRPNLHPQVEDRPGQTVDLKPTETKFQVSFKFMLASFQDDQRLALWGAYSQQSAWQVFHAAASRPFRETNYEPELMLAWRPDYEVLGLRWKLLTVGINHQSNGRSEPLSRSWNRVMTQFGLERGPFALILRPWFRISEPRTDDDNPDIERYLGHGEVVGLLQLKGHTLTGLGRLNAATGKGAFQLTWSFPLQRRVRGHVQIFTGYGESLVDYNWHQNTIGVGFSLNEWL